MGVVLVRRPQISRIQKVTAKCLMAMLHKAITLKLTVAGLTWMMMQFWMKHAASNNGEQQGLGDPIIRIIS